MTTRATMADLIGEIRLLCNIGTGDFTIGTVAYFSDQHVQDALDGNSIIYDFHDLTSFPQRSGDAYIYKIYDSGIKNWEGSPVVMDGTAGTIAGTAYTFSAALGRVTFGSDQGGSARVISGTAYDINRTAAEIWRKKAALYAEAYDISSDGQSLSRSQLSRNALDQARRFEAMAMNGANGAGVIYAERGDM